MRQKYVLEKVNLRSEGQEETGVSVELRLGSQDSNY